MTTALRQSVVAAVLIFAMMLVATSFSYADQGAKTDSATNLRLLQSERTALASALSQAVVAVSANRPDLALPATRGNFTSSQAASGFVVDGSYVITCMDASQMAPRGQGRRAEDNFVQPGHRVWMMAHDGTEFEGTVVGRDMRNLLVVIKMDDGHPDLPSLKLGDSDKVAMGASAVGLGNTLDSMLHDQTVSFSYGAVSGMYRFEPVHALWGDNPDTHGDPYRGNVLETDVAVHNGDHGGPLCNLDGEVIGMLTGHTMPGRHLGCAVPVNQIRAVLPQLKRGVAEGDLARGWLGFTARSQAESRAIMISQIEPDSPAAKAGLQDGWELVRVDNYVIPDFGRLREMLGVTPLRRTVTQPGGGMFGPPVEREAWVSYGVPVNTHIQVTVRNPESGEEKTLSLQVGERAEDF